MGRILGQILVLISATFLLSCKLTKGEGSQIYGLDPVIEKDLWRESGFKPIFTAPSCASRKIKAYRPRFNGEFVEVDGARIYPKREDVKQKSAGESGGVPTSADKVRFDIPAGVYCSADDEERVRAEVYSEADEKQVANPVGRVIKKMNEMRKGDELFVINPLFGSDHFRKALCDASVKGVAVSLTVQKPVEGTATFLSLDSIKKECSQIQLNLILDHERSMETKFVLMLYHSDEHSEEKRLYADLIFSSGSFGSNVWGQHESWGVVHQRKDYWLIQDHLCLAQNLVPEMTVNLLTFTDAMERCRDRNNINLRRFGGMVSSYFIPLSTVAYNDRKELIDDLTLEIRRSKKVQIAAQHLVSKVIYGVLLEKLAAEPDFEVEILLDSEVYWSAQSKLAPIYSRAKVYYPHDDYLKYCKWGRDLSALADDCAKVDRLEYRDYILPLQKARAKVRFLENNAQFGMSFDPKYLIIHYKENGQGAVFAGTGHFSQTGFARNFASFYLMRIPEIVAEYSKEFDRIYGIAQSVVDLPITWDLELEPVR